MSDSLSNRQIQQIVGVLKGWKIKVTGLVSWDNAQVTKGGISLDEINFRTMESRLVKGLYIVGELCDIDSKCGGYNLQWAWASGLLAGREAAKCIE
jgi:predicted flavoprotein YhiN